MRVAELIAELQKLPQDAVVLIVSEPNFNRFDQEVRDVILNEDGTVELDNWPAL